MAQQQHYSVLLQEAVDALVTDPDGVYVDGTFGRGGHSTRILERLSDKGRLFGFDKDPEAVAVGRELTARDGRFEMVHDSFARWGEVLQDRGLEAAGLLLDLGVSSPQLDQAERGFSFTQDGPLDMRMNPDSGISAAQWLAEAEESDIAYVLKTYGEERFAKRMARAIVESRARQPLTRTLQLAKLLTEANPAWEKHKHPATRAFQGIRIYINNELGDLETALAAVHQNLRIGGRLVVISFHSLEDRIVKQFIRRGEKGNEPPRGVPITADQVKKTLKKVGKPLKAGGDELGENIRSRSAIMRVAERLS